MLTKRSLFLLLVTILMVGCESVDFYQSINPSDLYDSNYFENSLQNNLIVDSNSSSNLDNDSGLSIGMKNDLKAFDYYKIAIDNFRKKENYKIVGIGNVYSIINQKVNSTNIKNNNQYFTESLSKSSPGLINIAIGERYYKENEIKIYYGTPNETATEAKWNQDGEMVDEEEFFSRYYKKLSDPFPYIISSKTVIKEETIDKSKFKLTLDPTLSVYYYSKQMQYISQLDQLPIFSKVEFFFEIDGHYDFKTIKILEDYKTKKFLSVNCSADMRLYFSYKIASIPSLDENCSYSID